MSNVFVLTHLKKHATLNGFSHVQLFATLWTVAHQAPLSTEFFRQEYWNRDLPDPVMEPKSPVSPALQVDSLPSEPPGKPKVNTPIVVIVL